MSAKPLRISESRDLAVFSAVSMRWTMSWSVPWVAMVKKVMPMSAAKIVYSVSSIARRAAPNGFAVSHPVWNIERSWPASCSWTVRIPPGMSRKTATIENRIAPIIRQAWMRSVHTTALIPPAAV